MTDLLVPVRPFDPGVLAAKFPWSDLVVGWDGVAAAWWCLALKCSLTTRTLVARIWTGSENGASTDDADVTVTCDQCRYQCMCQRRTRALRYRTMRAAQSPRMIVGPLRIVNRLRSRLATQYKYTSTYHPPGPCRIRTSHHLTIAV